MDGESWLYIAGSLAALAVWVGALKRAKEWERHMKSSIPEPRADTPPAAPGDDGPPRRTPERPWGG